MEDMNAAAGTFKNGIQLRPYERVELLREDEVKFGKAGIYISIKSVNSGIDTNLEPSYRECGQIRGMTTSVSLWTVSAIGIAVGAGLYIPAV